MVSDEISTYVNIKTTFHDCGRQLATGIRMKTRATAYPIWNRFQRSPDDPLSLREQLVRFFRKGVADGTLQPGIRLPASRVLAQELSLSRITVSGAYEQLVAEGFLEARRGAGTYVAARIAEAKAAFIDAFASGTTTRAGSVRAGRLVGVDSMSMARAAWPLTPGLPALDAFPYALWGRLEGRFWRRRPIPDLSYGDPQGFPAAARGLGGVSGRGAWRCLQCAPDRHRAWCASGGFDRNAGADRYRRPRLGRRTPATMLPTVAWFLPG
jgi:DNA-binding transcriptional regulator YhcF (GntR family)